MKNKKIKSSEELRFENEVRKAKLTLERGAQFYSGESAQDLPPDIESKWLDDMEKFENALENGDEIMIYDFIGRPEFIKESELSDDEIPKKLEEVEEILLKHGIMCDKICEVDDRVFYKFITEELFHKETLNIQIPDMMTHFIYEEFHPNPELDIKDLCECFTRRFCDEDVDYFNKFINTEKISNRSELLSFRNSFVKCSNTAFKATSKSISGHLATVHFNFSFDGYVNHDTAPIHYDGDGRFDFEFIDELWYFTRVWIPGMKKSE
jgi:hypothetical protein